MKTEPLFIFDTNALISVALLPSSNVRLALQKAEKIGKVIFSDETLAELAEVLLRKKFDKYLSVADRLEFIKRLELRSLVFPVWSKIDDCRDPKDNKFLILAVDAKAMYIITGDKDLLELHPFSGVNIISPAAFISVNNPEAL